MSTPIKRLEIIKNAIELEDDDIIQSQLTRLKNEAFDDELQAIVVALEEKNYTAAMAAITAWLQGQRAVTPWRDPQVAASKLELKALEERLRDLIDRRNARVQQLDEFNDLYFSRLGPLMPTKSTRSIANSITMPKCGCAKVSIFRKRIRTNSSVSGGRRASSATRIWWRTI